MKVETFDKAVNIFLARQRCIVMQVLVGIFCFAVSNKFDNTQNVVSKPFVSI